MNLTKQEYENITSEMMGPGKFDLDKISRTIKEVWYFMTMAGNYIIVDGHVKKLRWYNLLTWIDLAKLAYDLIGRITEIWKTENS